MTVFAEFTRKFRPALALDCATERFNNDRSRATDAIRRILVRNLVLGEMPTNIPLKIRQTVLETNSTFISYWPRAFLSSFKDDGGLAERSFKLDQACIYLYSDEYWRSLEIEENKQARERSADLCARKDLALARLR